MKATSDSLTGLTVLVTRPGVPGARLTQQLASRGAVVQHLPAIAIADPADLRPLDAAVRSVHSFNWVVFTSVNAVERFTDRAAALAVPLAIAVPPRIAAVGPATAAAIRQAWRTPDLVGNGSSAAALAERLGARSGIRVLLPGSAVAREELPGMLAAAGAEVQVVAAYRPIEHPALPRIANALLAGDVDAVVFASPSAVFAVSDSLSARATPTESVPVTVICIGGTTAAAARDAGYLRVIVADAPSDVGIATALGRLLVAR